MVTECYTRITIDWCDKWYIGLYTYRYIKSISSYGIFYVQVSVGIGISILLTKIKLCEFLSNDFGLTLR